MCGISGFFLNEKKKINEISYLKTLTQLSRELNHRGPDSNNFWHDSSNNIFLGHNRLKIIDLSDTGNQPINSYTGKLKIIYNGEIYNHQEIKNKLLRDSKNTISFRSKTDTEILINAIDFWGLQKTLNEITGMYSFVLWDKKEKKLTLCRDRFGEKPLYYLLDNEGLYFSSEIKALLSLNKKKLISTKNFEHFKSYGYNIDDDTIYENIKSLPTGSYVQFKQKNIQEKKFKIFKYWDSTLEAKKSLKNLNLSKISDISNQIEMMIENIVQKQLIADVETGVFLSGGIDSSLVTALAQKNSSKKISSFSIGFDINAYDESESAGSVANILGTKHKTYVMTSNDLIKIILKKNLFDEPFYDISQYPTYILSKFASEHVKVCLSGDGGDELFGGYNRYLIEQKNILKIHKIIKFLKLQNISKKIIDKSFFQILLNKTGFEQTENKIDKLKALVASRSEKDLYEKILRVENYTNIKSSINYEKISSVTDNFMINDTNLYLPNNILYKVDRLSMLNSLEIRTPFLDKELFKFAWSVPSNVKFYKKKTKYILKKILSKYLPNELIDKPKVGFDIPLFYWIKNNKRLEQLIKEFYFLKNKKILEMNFVDKQGSIEINKNNFTQIWKIAMINKWIFENY